MSPPLGFLIAVALAALALIPTFVPPQKLDAFGAWVHDAGKRGRHVVKKSLPAVGTLLILAIAVPTVGGTNPGELERLESRHHGFAHVIYVIDLVLAGIFGVLVATAILLAVALFALWVLSRLLAKLPTGTKALALAFFILAVGVAASVEFLF